MYTTLSLRLGTLAFSAFLPLSLTISILFYSQTALSNGELTGNVESQLLVDCKEPLERFAPAKLEPPSTTLKGNNASRKYPTYVFQSSSPEGGVVYNGTRYGEFQFRLLPKSKLPAVVGSPPGLQPVARLVFLHGFGGEMSNVGSVLSTGRILDRMHTGGNALANWFVEQYPHLKIPVQFVAFDLPSAGWAPPLHEIPTGLDLAKFIESRLDEVGEELGSLPTYVVCRSASCAPALMVNTKLRGVVITGATFPDNEVLDANIDALRQQEARGERPQWDVVDLIIGQFRDEKFYDALISSLKRKIPVLSLVGDDDAQSPIRSQKLWENAIGPTFDDPYYRSQHVLKGARHQVFSRPFGIPDNTFSPDHSDIRAFRLLLEFIRHHESQAP